MSFKTSTSPIAGLVIGEFLDLSLIQEVLAFIEQEKAFSWKDAYGNDSRVTVNYGWDFSSMEHGTFQYIEIPEIIKKIRDRTCTTFVSDLEKPLDPESFDNVIISIYKHGHYLSPHYDADMTPDPLTKREFAFGEPIIGAILQADSQSKLSFYLHDKPGKPNMDDQPLYCINEADGLTFLMQGASRHRPYFHGVPPVNSSRISITFRRTEFAGKDQMMQTKVG